MVHIAAETRIELHASLLSQNHCWQARICAKVFLVISHSLFPKKDERCRAKVVNKRNQSARAEELQQDRLDAEVKVPGFAGSQWMPGYALHGIRLDI